MNPRRRTRGSATFVLLLSLLLPAQAWGNCPPIMVRLVGRVTSAESGRPLKRLPITLRIETENRGLPDIRFDAVVTDKQGRFRWTREFHAEPCRDGGFLVELPGILWGRFRHPRDEAYHRGAQRLPQRIRLQLPQRIRIISRDELLRSLDSASRSALIRLDLSL